MFSPPYPGNETAWMLTRPPVYLAGLLSRRLGGESVMSSCKAHFGLANNLLTFFCK